MKKHYLSKNDIYNGNLILINSKYQYHDTKETVLLPVDSKGVYTNNYINYTNNTNNDSSMLLRDVVVYQLSKLMDDIDGWKSIVPVSAWRSFEEQQQIWDDSILESGREFTEKYVAVPGHSEHQTGLAIDVGLQQENIDFICPEFLYTGICQIFREKSVSYGFVERYPLGKERITGIGHEPWHFRYIGVPHASIMSEKNMVLEEYISFIKQYVYGVNPYIYRLHQDGACFTELDSPNTAVGQEFYIAYINAECADGIEISIDDNYKYSISGNNVDGYIVTTWI